MKIIRRFESLADPNDTMFVEVDDRYRYTRRGKNWAKFREDLIKVLDQTISAEMAEEFEKKTEDWVPAEPNNG